MSRETLWIVVVDLARGRIFQTDALTSPWTRVRTFEQPQGRAKVHEVVEGHPGRTSDSRSHSAGLAPHTDLRTQQLEHFSSDLAKELREAYAKNVFGRLVLIAPAKMLGELRRDLGDVPIVFESPRDLTNAPDHELPARVAELRAGSPLPL